MHLRTLFILLLSIITTQTYASNWEGTWQTSFGDLNLIQIGDYVVGDYADVGVIVGQRKGNQLTGVFTNHKNSKSGRFTFVVKGAKFDGAWHFENSNNIQSWTGRWIQKDRPSLKNFSDDNFTFTAVENTRKLINGIYKSPYGEIRLQSQDNILIGDYAKQGIIVGVWDENQYKGYFTNNGKMGWFKFQFFSKDGSFRSGEWGWYGKGRAGDWILSNKIATNPRLFQIAPKDAKTVVFMNEKLAKSNTTTQSQPKPKPIQPNYKTVLNPTSIFNIQRVNTISAMQHHIKWISQPNEADVIQSLKSDGYTIEGDELITTESDDPLFKSATTARFRSYVAVRGDDVVICFRGSSASNKLKTGMNGLTDANITVGKLLFLDKESRLYEQGKEVQVHNGFNLSYYRLREKIFKAISKHKGKNIYIFGHSLGGAQATLCALDLAINETRTFNKLTLIVSGCPRVGDSHFKSYFDKNVLNALRIEIENDLVPMVPPQIIIPALSGIGYKYKHVGDLLVFYPNGTTVNPSAINKKPRKAEGSLHANTTYFDTIEAFVRLAKTPNYFQGKAALPKDSGNAERNL